MKDQQRVIVLGTAQAGITLVRELLARPELNLKVVGFLDEKGENIGKSLVNPSIIGSVHQVSDIVKEKGVSRVILVPAGPKASDTAKAQSGIQSAAARLKAGGDFGKLAGELSADGSKSDSGYLPPGPRGQFVKEFEAAAWSLEPGQVSGVVKTQFGFHLIRRPTQEQARRRLLGWLRERDANHKDSVYLAELSGKYGLKVAGGAAQAMRAAATDLEGNRRSTRTVVSLKGGDVTVGDVVKWVSVYPPNVRLQIQRANDSLLGDFAKGLATSTLLLRQADSAGVKLQGPAWQFVRLQYTNAIDGLRADLGLSVPELSDSSHLSGDQKAKLAHEKVEDYFNRLLQGRAQVRPLLPMLAAELRGSGRGRVNQAGLARAVELATARVRRDTAGRVSGPVPGLIQRAPGGPPIGGQSAPPPAPASGSKKP